MTRKLSRGEARRELVRAAVSLVSSELWCELHCDDPHALDEIDLKREQLDEAAVVFFYTADE